MDMPEKRRRETTPLACADRFLRGAYVGLFGLSLVLFNVAVARADAPTADRELELKAAFLYNFTKFLEWPADRFASPHAPIVIGVFGSAPFADALQEVVRGRRVNSRALQVTIIRSAEDAKSMHVLFIPRSEESTFAQWSPGLSEQSILTVGESPSFLEEGGTIEFLVHEDKLRFEINMDAADRAGIRISAQLQKLAVNVRRTFRGVSQRDP